MPKTKSPTSLEAERLCSDFPDSSSHCLAKALSRSHKCSTETARDAIRYARGNHGDMSRKSPASPRPNFTVAAMPPSLAKPYTPFKLGNDIRLAVLSDIHVPYHSETAVSAAIDYCKKQRPTDLLVNGDFMDYYSISRYEKDPSKVDFDAEIECGAAMFKLIRKSFPKCRIVYKHGNHDERYAKWIWANIPLLRISKRLKILESLKGVMSTALGLDELGIDVVEDQRPVMAGKLPILHGHESGKAGLSSSVNGARGLFLKTLGSMLVGHGHRTSQHAETDWRHKQICTWTTGCLCELNPEYWRVGNRWNWGAARITVDKSGEYDVDNFRIGPNGEIWQ